MLRPASPAPDGTRERPGKRSLTASSACSRLLSAALNIGEIEDYLLSCTRYGTPTCWPREDDLGPDDEMRRYALDALAISCGERGRARIQEYADDPQYEFSHIIAEHCFKLRDQVLSHGEEIPKTLSPVLPREK